MIIETAYYEKHKNSEQFSLASIPSAIVTKNKKTLQCLKHGEDQKLHLLKTRNNPLLNLF